MHRGWAAVGILALLAAAVSWADGGREEDPELIEQLRALHASIEQLATGTGFRYESFPVADLLRPVPSFRGPNIDQTDGDCESPLFGDRRPGRPHFKSMRELAERIMAAVEPQTWDAGGTIEPMGYQLLVHQSEEVRKGVRLYLDQLRERLHRCICIETRVSAEDGRVIFHGRALGLASQRISLVHGVQHALYGDPEVEVAKDNGQTTDPIIEVLQAGGYLTVRACVGEDPATLRVELDFGHRELSLPVRKRETAVNGELEMPTVARRDCRTDLIVPAGRWVRVTRGIELKVTATPAARAR